MSGRLILTGARWYGWPPALWTVHYRQATPAQVGAGAKLIVLPARDPEWA